MTDRETLFGYRLKQAEDTFLDSEKMLEAKLNPGSVVNRAYYSMFYMLLALFLKNNISIKTSKHIGIISIFDKEFVHTGRIDKSYSVMLHSIFNLRLKADYKELAIITSEDAGDA